MQSLLRAFNPALLEVDASYLHQFYPETSIVRLAGERDDPPLFISILLHGNEVSGLRIMQKILRFYDYPHKKLPRTTYLLLGNISAATHNLRSIPGELDYNRIWHESVAGRPSWVAEILNYFQEKPPLFAVDIHNNTGKNPHYGCINNLKESSLKLAGLFSRRVIHYTHPREVLGIQFSEICPTITLECGLPEDPLGIDAGIHFLKRLYKRESSAQIRAANDLEVYETEVKIIIPPEYSISFGSHANRCDFIFPQDIENYNFVELEQGHVLGRRTNPQAFIKVINQKGIEVTKNYIDYQNDEIILNTSCLPVMITRNITVIHDDCFCYLMRPLSDLDE